MFYSIKGNICGIVNNIGAALYHSAYVIIGGGILPSMIMIICACLIRQNLAHKQQRRAQLSLPHHKDNSIDHQVLRILFLQIICYIIFIIPQLGNLVFNTISVTMPNRSQDHLAIEQFVSFIAECILYLFPVTSFYLYTLTSRTFRKELIKIFRLSMGFRGDNRITPTTAVATLHRRTENNAEL
jgi:H+/gluconate symporter-like permease